MKPYTPWNPYLEKCCLLLSANEAYARAAEDIHVLTGRAISLSTQHRMVHRQTFEAPAVETPVEEISLDRGKVRLRTFEGQPCEGRDYKAVTRHNHIGSGAVESTVKQFGGRINISGAQWGRKYIPQVLKHRAAYLNGQ